MSQVDVLYLHPLGSNPSFSLKYFNEANKNNSAHLFGFIPMGIIGILNNLRRNGISVKGVNLALKKRVNPSFDLRKCLEILRPRIVLIDMHWYVHIRHGIEIARICKERSNCKVVVGGLSATLFHKQLLDIEYIDYIVKGDAEMPLLGLAKSILGKEHIDYIPNVSSRDSDNEIEYICTDIDDYDYVSLDFLEDKESYLNMFDFWLMTGKGCPYDCENCDGNRAKTKVICGRTRTIFRDADKIIEDLVRIEGNTVGFSLDIELMPEEVLDKIAEKRFSLNLRNEFFQLAGIGKIRKIKDSFNSIELVFSPTSGDDKERKEYGKRFTNLEFLELLKEIKGLGIRGGVVVYFTDHMISPLGSRKLDEEARDRLIRQIKEIIPETIIEILPQIADPGSLKGRVGMDKLFGMYTC